MHLLLFLFGLFFSGEATTATINCPLVGYFEDSALTIGAVATLTVEYTTTNGENVPISLTVSHQNDASFFYTKPVPGSGVQSLCDLSSWGLSLYKTFGYSRVDQPIFPAPYNLYHWHFKTTTELLAINPSDSHWSACVNYVPPVGVLPDNSISIFPACVPTMGLHWASPEMDLWDPLDAVQLWGIYNEQTIFLDAMVPNSLFDSLAGRAAGSQSAKSNQRLPRLPQLSGYYPTLSTVSASSNGNVDPLQGTQTATFSNFVYIVGLDAPPPPQPPSPQPCPVCFSAASPVVFSSTLVVFLLAFFVF